jgi:Fe2+ transport system protein FeoA
MTAASAGTTLDTVGRNRRVRVLRVVGGRRLVQRLAALGIVPGVSVTVDRVSGPALVAVGGTRIAVGRQAARAVEVEEETA